MFSKVDLIAVIGALGAHVGIALGLIHFHVPDRPRSSIVEMEVRKPAPPVKVETPPEPKKPEPEPPKKVVMKEKKIITPPPVTPPPNQDPPPEPPKEPPKPVFGVSMSSTTEGDSSFAVPVGNTTMIDPKKSAKGVPVAPLPAAKATAPEYKPIQEVFIKAQPEIDGEACGRAAKYTDEAEQLGIEGSVTLRIELDEKGHVHGLKVIKGLGHGLDEVAMRALRYSPECKFKPAFSTDGKAAAYVINNYKFTFELQR